jgi:hypothetical protein
MWRNFLVGELVHVRAILDYTIVDLVPPRARLLGRMRPSGLMDNMFVKLHALQANTTIVSGLKCVMTVHQVRLLQELMQ